MSKQKLALIIPTKDRHEQLRNLLFSIRKQGYRPEQIIIVDGSRVPFDKALSQFVDMNIDYVRVAIPSLPKQRNDGIRLIRPEVSLVAFLDDDIEMEDNSLREMTNFWETAPSDLGGTCFNIITDKPSKNSWLKHIFLTGNSKMGTVLPSGYNTKICPSNENIYTRWLLGGVTVWRKSIINEFKFDEWFQGYGLFEDFEFSYRVGKFYRLAVVSNAKVKHNFLGIRRKDNFRFGKMEIMNRFYIVKKNPELSTGLFFWASIGQCLENLFRVFSEREKGYLLRALGNLTGLAQVITHIPSRGVK